MKFKQNMSIKYISKSQFPRKLMELKECTFIKHKTDEFTKGLKTCSRSSRSFGYSFYETLEFKTKKFLEKNSKQHC